MTVALFCRSLLASQPNLIFRHCSGFNKNINDTTSVGDETEKKNKPNKPRQLPEAPTTCCMTGCPNCVWLEYAEELTNYFNDGGEKALEEIEKHVTDPNVKAYLMHELRSRSKER